MAKPRAESLAKVKTMKDGTGHTHTVMVDKDGNGTTTLSQGHQHMVVNYIAMQANSHEHIVLHRNVEGKFKRKSGPIRGGTIVISEQYKGGKIPAFMLKKKDKDGDKGSEGKKSDKKNDKKPFFLFKKK